MYFLDNMPRGSHYWAARMSDKDMAEAILDVSEGGSVKAPTTPPLLGWTSEIEALTNILDMQSISLHAHAGDSKGFKPQPRPETALDIVKRERKDKKMSAVEARLAGKG